ncbi:hypothetical protein BVX98_06550 [bacterium F11]|nr:hypothetical protein BVX98_06550 [bacterium F11]
MTFEFYLANRYLISRRHGVWGWIISSIATGSVALGVAALIVTLAIMTGFREDIRSKMLGVQPHVLMTSFSGKINPKRIKADEILNNNPQISDWAPFVTGQILIGKGKLNSGAKVKGIDPKKEPSVVNVMDRLREGQWEDLREESLVVRPDKPKIILGQELARHIGARVGNIVWVVTPNSIGISAFSIPKAHLFEVSGILHTGLYDFDSALAYTHLSSAQTLFNMGTEITGYGISLKDIDGADQIASDLQISFKGDFWVRSWLSQNKNLFSALKLERTVMFLILAMLSVVAAFMIVTNLLLNITQKVKEIGILRAMGATPQIIRKIFLYQGLLMGIVGNFIGIIIGVGISLFLAKSNIIHLPADVYYIDKLPIRLIPIDICSVVILSLLIVVVATIYPANKAAQLDPLDAIRYG